MNQITHSSPDNYPDDLLPEYDFDYSKALKNRFAKSEEEQITIILDPDIAEIFKTSESVNRALRLLLSAIPK
jgi:hypothetical protein